MKISKYHSKKGSEGFTIVEVLTSLVVIGVFITIIFQLFIFQSGIGASWLRFESAEQLAYNNMNKYGRYEAAQTTTCADYPTSSSSKTLFSQSAPVSGLPSPVSQQVVSSMPYGCDAAKLGNRYPIKIISTVTYGPDSKQITHATYVNAGS